MMHFPGYNFPNYGGPVIPTPPPYKEQKNNQNFNSNYCANPYFPKNFSQKNDKNTYNDNNFNFFGIKLENDDLIILALLFFLYIEKVDDTFLFIALILLLLS